MASLSEHFQAVTTEKTKVSFLKIAFGEATGAEIQGCSQGSKYTAWFVKKYESSQKYAHQMFIHFIQIYTERLEMTQESDPLSRPSTLELRA